MTNVLLIVPPNITYTAFKRPTNNTKAWRHKNGNEYGILITDVPLGVLTLSSILKEKFDANVKLIDFNVLIHQTWDHHEDESFENWFYQTLNSQEIHDFDPDYIGFSSLFVTGYDNLLQLSQISRTIFPDTFQIAGGNVPTTMYEELFKEEMNSFDAFCYGEAELSLEELLKSEDKTEYCEKSPHWITRANVEEKQTFFTHNYIQDLDEIPRLDYSLIDLDNYHRSPTINSYTSFDDNVRYITYMTSRGCPFLCTFCSAHTVHGRKMRYFGLERIEEELTDLVSYHSINTLVIEDDHFMADKKRAHAILKIAQKLKLTCFFPNALALYALDYEMLEALHKTGVRQLTLAVESGSARVLKELMKKPLRLDIIYEVTKNCAELGIYTDCNIIIGMPGETKQDIEDTRSFLKTLSANWYRINVATPLAGSEMFITAQQKGQIKGDIRKAGYKNCVIETDEFTPDEIENVAYDLNLELNFLNNIDMRVGNFEKAIKSFENVLSVKEDHALANYCLSNCYQAMGNTELANEYMSKAYYSTQTDEFWKDFFTRFDLNAHIHERLQPSNTVSLQF